MKQFKPDNEQVGNLCGALAHLFHAGIGPGDALALLAEDEDSSPEKQMLQDMSRKADEGVPLSEIFRQANCFPDYVSNLLAVGNRVGRSEEALTALSGYYDRRASMERQLKNTLLYPAVLMVVLLAVLFILLVWVLPVFNDVYVRLGSSLTGIAGGLLKLGGMLRLGMPVLCAILLTVLGFAVILSKSYALQGKLLGALRKIFGDMGIIRRINTSRFVQALAMGMAGGLTDREAVELASGLADGSEEFSARCVSCLAKLEEGADLSEALRESRLLSKAECRLLSTGIKSGSGDRIMDQIALRVLEESEQELENLAGRIEPVVVVAMSLMVGVILLSVMLPMMNIMSAIG